MVSTSALVSSDSNHLRTIDYALGSPKVSVIVCTSRKESLERCLYSLSNQFYRHFEVLVVEGKGDLPRLRNLGWEQARGEIVSFVDDDVECPPMWLENIVSLMEDERIMGVTGPISIPEAVRQDRDIFKHRWLYRWLFEPTLPAHLQSYGAPSYRANDVMNFYEGPCQYLEACNMTLRNQPFFKFSQEYKQTGEWHEVDLALDLARHYKGKFWYTPLAAVTHHISQTGCYKDRLDTAHRWQNFKLFQDKWGKRSAKFYLFRLFMWLYFKLKGVMR